MAEKIGEEYFSKLEKLLVVIGAFAFTIVVASYSYNFGGDVSDDINDWAKLGDFFGGVLNPFIAFLALIAIVVTLRYTRIALRLTEQSNKTTIESLNKANTLSLEQYRLSEEQTKQKKLDSLFNHIIRIDAEQSELLRKTYTGLEGVELGDLFFEGDFFKKNMELGTKFHWDRMQVLMNTGLIYASLLEYKKLQGKKDGFFMGMAMKYLLHIKIPHILQSAAEEYIPEEVSQTIKTLHDLYLEVEKEVGTKHD